MKSWKEEKSRKTSQGARTLQEASKPYISDYEIDNYIKAYNYARRVLRAPLEDIYDKCCGPESKYHLDVDMFEGLAEDAFTAALERFLEVLKISKSLEKA